MDEIRTTFDKLSWKQRNKHILSAAKSALTHYSIGKAELIEISPMGNTVKFCVQPRHQREKFILSIHYPVSDMPSRKEIESVLLWLEALTNFHE